MKKFNLLSMLFSVAIVVSLIMVGACTKEGPAGKDGVDGKDGEPGLNGSDGTATCAVCHDNSETVETKIGQWGASKHAIGGTNFENRTTCAPCHTSQGFKEVVNTDLTATAAEITDPANINCYTCHMIHDTYATADWDLRKTASSASWLTGDNVDFGAGNLCAQCHQMRTSYVIPDVTQPDAIYTVTSSRFGPHHGPQSGTLGGYGFYMVGTGYNNSSHLAIDNTCVTCHMASAVGYYTGGHTFAIHNEEEGYNFAGCAPCHTADEAEANMEELTTNVTDLLAQLATILETEGILNPTAGNAVSGDYTNKVAGAYWNYITIMEDRSMGAHNPKFVERILTNTIASFN